MGLTEPGLCTGLTEPGLCTGLTEPSLCMGLTEPGLCMGLTEPGLCKGLTELGLCMGLTEPGLCMGLTEPGLCTGLTGGTQWACVCRHCISLGTPLSKEGRAGRKSHNNTFRTACPPFSKAGSCLQRESQARNGGGWEAAKILPNSNCESSCLLIPPSSSSSSTSSAERTNTRHSRKTWSRET